MDRILNRIALLLVCICASTLLLPAATVYIDENGHGFFDGIPMQFFIGADTGPGGLANVLTYVLPAPVATIINGDLFLQDAGVTLDVIRFNTFNGVNTIAFYSDNVDGADALADTPSPPAQFYGNTVAIPEVGPEGDNGAVYTPLVAQPGFAFNAAGGPIPMQYRIVSDVPEPVSLALIGAGCVVLSLRRRRLV